MKSRYQILTILLVSLTLPWAAHAQCPKNPSCQQMKECKSFETFRIPFETIQGCIEQGMPPPDEWKRLGGKGAINTGGSLGNVSIGSLNNPYISTASKGSGSGDSSDGGGPGIPISIPGGSDGGDGDDSEVDCSDYRDPRLMEPCELRGPEKQFSESPSTQCGAAIQLDHEWSVLNGASNQAAMTNGRDTKLYVYNKSGSSLSQSTTSDIPSFYCQLREHPTKKDPITDEPEIYAEKVPIIPRKHYVTISNNTRVVAVLMDYPEGTFGGNMGESSFVVMTRDGSSNRFSPPTPNPDYFTNLGAVDVDPNCYTPEHLTTDEIPNGFGELMFGKTRRGNCGVEQMNLHNFMQDPSTCLPFIQEYNTDYSQLVVPPGSSLSSGNIGGSNAYSATTIRGADGSFSTTNDGTTYYTGPQLFVDGSSFLLGTGMRSVNEQAFLGGAVFRLSDTRGVRVNPPGRIRLFNDWRMQLVDGGQVEDNAGNVVRQISPNAYVQFPQDVPIKGAAFGNIKIDSATVLPTNQQNIVRQPYDTRLDTLCRK